jgi:DNA replication protein DnaC
MRREHKFATICPSLYQKTEANRLPATQLAKALEWQYGARGLILLGDTGKGKSRVAWTLLKRVLVEDKKEQGFMWFDAISFGHQIAKHYRDEDAEDWLDRVAQCPLVFFDDLGKLKLTERAEVELFGVIERRCAAELPIIVTTNDTGDSLAARMTDNRGPAMIRRLREFCEPIQF